MLGPLLVGGFVNRPQRCWRAEKPSRLRCRCGAFANAPYDSEAIAGSRKLVASGTPPTVSSCADTFRKRASFCRCQPSSAIRDGKTGRRRLPVPENWWRAERLLRFRGCADTVRKRASFCRCQPSSAIRDGKTGRGRLPVPENWWRAERLLRFRGCADTFRKRASFCRCQPSSAIRDGKTGRGRSRTPR